MTIVVFVVTIVANDVCLFLQFPRSLQGFGPRRFLTSCSDDPAVLVRAIRQHGGVENALHWVLDVTFRENDSRVRDRTAARNFALVRKIALNLVARDRSPKPAYAAGAKRLPGTTATCSRSSHTKIMREPWC